MDFDEALACLGLPSLEDKNALRKAYRSSIRNHPPETDPEGFQKVRQAYEMLSKSLEARAFMASLSEQDEPGETESFPDASPQETADAVDLETFIEQAAYVLPPGSLAPEEGAAHPETWPAWQDWLRKTGRSETPAAFRDKLFSGLPELSPVLGPLRDEISEALGSLAENLTCLSEPEKAKSVQDLIYALGWECPLPYQLERDLNLYSKAERAVKDQGVHPEILPFLKSCLASEYRVANPAVAVRFGKKRYWRAFWNRKTDKFLRREAPEIIRANHVACGFPRANDISFSLKIIAGFWGVVTVALMAGTCLTGVLMSLD